MDVMLRQMTFTAKKGPILAGGQMEIQDRTEILNPPLKLQSPASNVSSLHLSTEASVSISVVAPSSSEASKICTKAAKRSSPLLLSASKSFLSDPLRFFWFPKYGNTGKKAKDIRSSDAPAYKSDLAIKQENLLQLDPSPKAEQLLDSIEAGKLRKPKAGPRKTDYADSATKIFTGLLHNVWRHKDPVKNPKNPSNLAEPDHLYICNGCEEQILSEILRSEDIQIAIRYTTTPEGHWQNNQAASEISPSQGCGECQEENGCSTEDAAAVHLHYDEESFSRMLHKVPVAEIRKVSKLSDLCRFAYIIPEMKAGDLLTQHNLTFVTSSLDRKAPASENIKDKADKGLSLSGNEVQNVIVDRSIKDAIVVGSTVQMIPNPTGSSSTLSIASPIPETYGDAENVTSSEICKDVPFVNLNFGSDEGPDEVASNLRDEGNLVVVPGQGYVKSESADSSLQAELGDGSLHTCPCEWFCCDDGATQTRFFVMQGSESLAAWQTNLTFDPVQFEGASLEILVHRGIYDAAKGLYHQLLPQILEHLKKHGDSGRIRLTGHSLGGSLATLLFFMLQIRGAVKSDALLPVMTFGSPSILCGGEKLLERLSIPRNCIQSVIMHRDIVPRSFSCHYPDNVSRILKKINGIFRHHPCLIHQKILYAPVGELYILQPEESVAPPHPFLPKGSGLYLMRHPIRHQSMSSYSNYSTERIELQAAYRAFLNLPHPLEILRDPTSYGSKGSISKNHNPHNYARVLDTVLLQELDKQIAKKCKKKRLLWPSITALSSAENITLLGLIRTQSGRGAASSTVAISPHESRQLASGPTQGGQHTSMITALGANLGRHIRYKRLIASQHVQMGMMFILSAKGLLVQGFLSLFAWI